MIVIARISPKYLRRLRVKPRIANVVLVTALNISSLNHNRLPEPLLYRTTYLHLHTVCLIITTSARMVHSIEIAAAARTHVR